MRKRKHQQVLNIKPAYNYLGVATRYVKLNREPLGIEVLPVYMWVGVAFCFSVGRRKRTASLSST